MTVVYKHITTEEYITKLKKRSHNCEMIEIAKIIEQRRKKRRNKKC